MSVTARIAAFVVALGLIFGAGTALGAAVGPLGDRGDRSHSGDDGRDDREEDGRHGEH
jgi:hypothetical protein